MAATFPAKLFIQFITNGDAQWKFKTIFNVNTEPKSRNTHKWKHLFFKQSALDSSQFILKSLLWLLVRPYWLLQDYTCRYICIVKFDNIVFSYQPRFYYPCGNYDNQTNWPTWKQLQTQTRRKKWSNSIYPATVTKMCCMRLPSSNQ